MNTFYFFLTAKMFTILDRFSFFFSNAIAKFLIAIYYTHINFKTKYFSDQCHGNGISNSEIINQ